MHFFLIFSFILVGVDLPQSSNIASAKENAEKIRRFNKEEYCVSLEYKVDSSWGDFYNLSIYVTNTTDNDISDWSFYFPFDGEIVSIWNANQEKVDDNIFCIKNAHWNQFFNKKTKLNIGMIVKSNKQPEIPSLAYVCCDKGKYSTSIVNEDGIILMREQKSKL